MVRVAIYGLFKENFPKECVCIVLGALEKHKAEVYLEESCAEEVRAVTGKMHQTFSVNTPLKTTVDFLISIGGDGTILRALTYIKNSEVPIVGVNTGRMGFLATIQKNEIETAIHKIIANEYKISKRSVLQLTSTSKHTEIDDVFNFALNEIAVSRKNTTSMIKVKTYLNEAYLTSYWADGLIVATPTGSTGYSLSCGGPVVAPDAKNIVLTPIAPHNLNARPLVIPDNTTVELVVTGREDEHLVSLDSKTITVANETVLTIKKASFFIHMIESKEESFLHSLRTKLLWGEDKRN